MNLPAELMAIEASLRARRITILKLLLRAQVDRATWTRWKNGETVPRLNSWLDVVAAVAELLPEHRIDLFRPEVVPSRMVR